MSLHEQMIKHADKYIDKQLFLDDEKHSYRLKNAIRDRDIYNMLYQSASAQVSSYSGVFGIIFGAPKHLVVDVLPIFIEHWIDKHVPTAEYIRNKEQLKQYHLSH